MALKNNRKPILSNITLFASFHRHMWIQTGVTVRKRLNGVVSSLTLTFDLWPWPFAWTSRLSIVITPENFKMIWWEEHFKKVWRTDRRTDRPTETSVLRAAWSQLKWREVSNDDLLRRSRSVVVVFQRKTEICSHTFSHSFTDFCLDVASVLSGFVSSVCSPRLLHWQWGIPPVHYSDVIMGTIVSQITSLTIVYSTVYLDADQRKHQSSTSLAFVWGLHRRPVNSPHKGPVTLKMFPFDDVIIASEDSPNHKNSIYPAPNHNKYQQSASYICILVWKCCRYGKLVSGVIKYGIW